MKPEIVFFGEGLPSEFYNSLEEDRDNTDLLIVIGSSLKVRPVATIPSKFIYFLFIYFINHHNICDTILLFWHKPGQQNFSQEYLVCIDKTLTNLAYLDNFNPWSLWILRIGNQKP